MKEFKGNNYSGERALFRVSDAEITECTFEDGESPLKESKNLTVKNCHFIWRYPLWYSENIKVSDSDFAETARAGIWYTNNISVKNAEADMPKSFRRCSGVRLENVRFGNAAETLWQCDNVILKDVTVKGDYFGMNSSNLKVDRLNLDGQYCFDGVRNIEVRNSKFKTKDAFWNSENVTVYDSVIDGEYLGWNSKNLTFINCEIVSLQGMCCIENLVMKNCRFRDTTLAFEYSSVDAEIKGKIDSIFNPAKGKIRADEIGGLIIEKDKVNPEETEIICDKIGKKSDKPEWL